MRARAGRPPARRGGPCLARPRRRAGGRPGRAARARYGPAERIVRNPKSARKSRGNTVRWTRKRSADGVSFAIAVGERLERAGALVPRLADRGEEERLLDPGLRVGEQVGAGHEHGVVGGRAGGQIGRAREQLRRPVLHRAEDAAVVVAVDRPPGAPLLLGPLDPLALVGLAIPSALPPDAALADGRRGLEGRARETGEPRGHRFDPSERRVGDRDPR